MSGLSVLSQSALFWPTGVVTDSAGKTIMSVSTGNGYLSECRVVPMSWFSSPWPSSRMRTLAVGEGSHQLLASRFETYPEHADLCAIEAGGTRLDPRGEGFLAATRFRMAGPALYRATARLFPGFLERLLGASGAADLDLVIPHQASRPALDHLRRVLGVDAVRMIDIFDGHGNQVASSLPHALHVAVISGRLRPGMTVLLIGSAAGVSLGGMVIRW